MPGFLRVPAGGRPVSSPDSRREPHLRPLAARPSPIDLSRTYVTLATPPGTGGIAVVELLGPRAGEIAGRIFRPRAGAGAGAGAADARAPVLGDLVDADGPFDEALMQGPAAAGDLTGLPAVVLSCHGGRAPVRHLLELAESYGATRLAPEHWAELACAAGRIDRLAREAWQLLPGARTRLAAEVFGRAAAGELRARIEPVCAALGRARSGLAGPGGTALDDARARLGELLATSPLGLALATPPRIVLVGAPNAGKSTLFNALVGFPRVLVHDEPGTTRDSIEEVAAVRGVPVLFVDTAGIRATADPIEAQGVAEAERQAGRADLVLEVVDAAAGAAAPEAARAGAATRQLRVLAQWDRVPGGRTAAGGLPVSAEQGTGLEELRTAILAALGLPALPAAAAMPFSARQVAFLRRAATRVEAAWAAWVRAPADRPTGPAQREGGAAAAAAHALRRAQAALERLVGPAPEPRPPRAAT